MIYANGQYQAPASAEEMMRRATKRQDLVEKESRLCYDLYPGLERFANEKVRLTGMNAGQSIVYENVRLVGAYDCKKLHLKPYIVATLPDVLPRIILPMSAIREVCIVDNQGFVSASWTPPVEDAAERTVERFNASKPHPGTKRVVRATYKNKAEGAASCA